MNVLFRLDCNSITGSGHFFRSLELAKKIIKNKNKVYFITRKIKNSYINLLKKEKISHLSLPIKDKRINNNYNKLFELEEISLIKNLVKKFDFKLIIIDHYSIAYQWEKKIKNYNTKILVIDDNNNNKHDCNFYLNSNLNIKKTNIEKKMINKKTNIFLGLKYIFVDSKYSSIINCKKNNSKIFIYFGNVDSNNVLDKILKIISNKEFKNFKKLVVLPEKKFKTFKIEKIKKEISNLYLYKFTNNLDHIMSDCMFSIGAAGHNLYERIKAGMLNYVVSQSNNQFHTAKKLESLKLINSCNHFRESQLTIKNQILSLIDKYNNSSYDTLYNLIDSKFNDKSHNYFLKKLLIHEKNTENK